MVGWKDLVELNTKQLFTFVFTLGREVLAIVYIVCTLSILSLLP